LGTCDVLIPVYRRQCLNQFKHTYLLKYLSLLSCENMYTQFFLDFWNTQCIIVIYSPPTVQKHTETLYSCLIVIQYTLISLCSYLPSPSSCQPLVSTTELSISMKSIFVIYTCEWNHAVLVVSVAYFTCHSDPQFYPH
jgi:hypothetical protein